MSIQEPINTSIDSSSWTAIALDGDTPCSSYMFHSRDGSDFMVKKTADSTNYYTVLDGKDIVINNHIAKNDNTLFYAKASAGTPVIEVFVFYDN